MLLQLGHIVTCPADRGDPAYSGQVSHIDPAIHTNIHGVRFRWVTVRRPCGRCTVWPSHRIGEHIAREA